MVSVDTRYSPYAVIIKILKSLHTLKRSCSTSWYTKTKNDWLVPLLCSRWFESNRIWAAGLIVGEVSTRACHWRAKRSLGSWLAARGVPGLCDVDTRALTFRLRAGVTLGRIIQGVPPFGLLPALSDPNARNLVAEVSVKVSTLFSKKIISVNLQCKFI